LKIKRILFVLLILYFFWLAYHLLSFNPPEAGSGFSRPYEVQGVYHVHSTLSDGRRSVDKITEIAKKTSVDFLILTDHGSPNRRCLAAQGWKGRLLLLSGSELSVSRGHLVGLDFDPAVSGFSQNADAAARQIKKANGFTIIAHPYSKTSWSWGKDVSFNGLEIMNADTMLKTNFIPLIPYLPSFFLHTRFALIKMLDRPEKNLRKWDELNRKIPVYAYFSTDAHLLYKPLFSLFRLHVLLDKPLSDGFETARRQVFDALRRGRFYNAVEAAAQAKGFRFYGQDSTGRIHMGGTADLAADLQLRVEAPFSFRKEIRLIRNGRLEIRTEEDDFSYKPQTPGVYRTEVYLKIRSPLRKNIPWIVSNPLYIRK
jgi:hypothetical protein